ncbi:MAG: hypothetical protein ABIP53_04815, partial [Candidatus Limnocylindrales bacterium]
ERSEGNPFYATELVRSLIDRVGPAPGAADISDALSSLPDTVQATVLARLDAMPALERRCLQLGSIFGRSFREVGLVALDEALSGATHAALSSLLDRDMIRATGDGYSFRHILIREVAYATLPRAERARLHLLAGQWLEGYAHGSEEAYAELIAYHFREAASLASLLGSATAQEARSKAVEWLLRAGEVALSAAIGLEAGNHFRKALEWAPSETQIHIQERIGDAQTGGEATVEAYQSAYLLARQHGLPADDMLRILGKLIGFEARFVGALGRRTDDETMARRVAEGHELAALATDPIAIARFEVAVGFLSWWRYEAGRAPESEAEEAAAHARRGLALADAEDAVALQSAALDALAALAQDKGEWDAAREIADVRLTLVERLPVSERLDAQSMAAYNAVAMGDLDAAERVTGFALREIQPGQEPNMALNVLNWRTTALNLLGRWDDALATAARAEQIWVDLNRPSTYYATGGFLAALDIARARREPEQVDRWRSVLVAIYAQSSFEEYSRRIARAHFDIDIASLAALLSEPRMMRVPSLIAQAIGLCADHAVEIASVALEEWRSAAIKEQTALVEAQARRCLALAAHDIAELHMALDLAERCGAMPLAARIRCELGLMSGDREMYAAGAGALESIGDIDQLERYESQPRT